MPKLKSHSGASKRFKMTKSGLIKYAHANRRHNIVDMKTTKRKRGLRKAEYVDPTNAEAIKKLLPYA